MENVYSYCDKDCHMRLYDVTATDEIQNRKEYESYGIMHFRFVFTDETNKEVESVFNAYNR